MPAPVRVCMAEPDAMTDALNATGIAPGTIAAGHLRQGHQPSMLAMVTGTAVIEVLRKRIKALPRSFVLAVTPVEVVAFKGVASGQQDVADDLHVDVSPEPAARWPRDDVGIEDFDDADCVNLTLRLGVDRYPVSRRNPGFDPNTVGMLAELAGASPG
jgi:hypothetical protein